MSTPCPVVDTAPPFMAVATDMDGTLLHATHEISDYTRQVLLVLVRDKKVPFICATARHHVDILHTKQRCGIPGYLISSNGARLHDTDNRLLLERNFDAAVAARLIALAAHEPAMTMSFYQGDHWYINRYKKEITEYYADSGDTLRFELYNSEQHDNYDGVFNVYYSCDEAAKLDALHASIRDAFKDELHLIRSPRALEVMPRGVDKASTLAMLLTRVLYPADAHDGDELLRRCVVFGDGMNDYEMLMKCGKGFVMAGASVRLREALPKDATHIENIGSAAEDAVANKLAELFSIAVPSTTQQQSS